MRILFVTLKPIGFNTSATLRNLALIEGLSQLGHQIEVLTIAETENSEWLDSTLKVPLGVEVSYLPQSHAYVSATEKHDGPLGKVKKSVLPLIRWLYHKLSIYDFTIMIAKKANVRYCKFSEVDLVISSSDPKSSHIAVKYLLKSGLKATHWIQYWGDPLAYDITNKTLWPRFVLKAIEHSMIKDADKVVYVSPFTLTQQRTGFKSVSDKFSFLPIPYREVNLYPTLKRYQYECSYLGDYYRRSRNIVPFVEAVGELKYSVVIAGNADIEINKENITVLKRVSQKQVREIEQNSRILICLLNARGNQIPGKLYHYAASNKPILVIMDGDNAEQMKAYLQSFDRFELCSNDRDEIKNSLVKLLSEDKSYVPSKRLDPKDIATEFISLRQKKE